MSRHPREKQHPRARQWQRGPQSTLFRRRHCLAGRRRPSLSQVSERLIYVSIIVTFHPRDEIGLTRTTAAAINYLKANLETRLPIHLPFLSVNSNLILFVWLIMFMIVLSNQPFYFFLIALEVIFPPKVAFIQKETNLYFSCLFSQRQIGRPIGLVHVVYDYLWNHG